MRFPLNRVLLELPENFSCFTKTGIVTEPSEFTPLLVESVLDATDNHKVVEYHSDVGFILRQQSISKELQPIIESVFEHVRSSDLSDKYSGLSDDDILSCIKSRYLQAPCEIQTWTSYLMSKLDEIADAVPAVPAEPTAPVVES